MSRSLNKVILSGCAANDAEFINRKGRKIVNFPLAVDCSYKQNGKWVDAVEYIRIRAYGALAEYLAEAVKTGARIELAGTLRNKLFTTKSNQTAGDMHVELNSKADITVFTRREEADKASTGKGKKKAA